jgi:hypothetical protein
MNYDQYVGPAGDDGNAQGGSGEELAQTLEKVVSQLDIISRTLHVLEQRVSMNEQSVNSVVGYFNDLKAQHMNQIANVGQQNVGYSQTQGNVINAYNLQKVESGTVGSGHLSFN